MKASEMQATGSIERPLVRYHGGKWELAPWIISHFPPHKIYCEPFAGGASVLLQKPRAWAEVYNDLDGEMVNLFQIVRDRGLELRSALEVTPFSRVEFFAAFERSADTLEQARRTIMRSHMGFAGVGIHGRTTGFRSFSRNSGSHPASQWRVFPDHLEAVVERMRGVVLENRDALEVIDQQDSPDTLFYLDPPYAPETRDAGVDYRHEMTTEQHGAFLQRLPALKGMVVLSGYPCAAYDAALSDWRRAEREALAERALARTEVLWISPNCPPPATQQSLFPAP